MCPDVEAPAEAARMSCPIRSNRCATGTMSSCIGVPTRWAIKPSRTAGCPDMISCNVSCNERIAKLLV
jgi:hypothetical protein